MAMERDDFCEIFFLTAVTIVEREEAEVNIELCEDAVFEAFDLPHKLVMGVVAALAFDLGDEGRLAIGGEGDKIHLVGLAAFLALPP
ncbi:MAG: hypothetical protein MR215_07145 [Bacteroidales bacterium]|nr:hypothetical protein [Bacteroidales bacterium]